MFFLVFSELFQVLDHKKGVVKSELTSSVVVHIFKSKKHSCEPLNPIKFWDLASEKNLRFFTVVIVCVVFVVSPHQIPFIHCILTQSASLP